MKAIFHADKKWGIGRDNGLMFSIPLDMKFFRETTKGKVVVMGRKTLLSFPNGKPLKNRVNVVLTTRGSDEDVIVVRDLSALAEVLKNYPTDDVYVIGGASVYRELLPYCTHALVTKVDADGNADSFAPDLDADKNFRLLSESEPQTDNGYVLTFCTYENTDVKQL